LSALLASKNRAAGSSEGEYDLHKGTSQTKLLVRISSLQELNIISFIQHVDMLVCLKM